MAWLRVALLVGACLLLVALVASTAQAASRGGPDSSAQKYRWIDSKDNSGRPKPTHTWTTITTSSNWVPGGWSCGSGDDCLAQSEYAWDSSGSGNPVCTSFGFSFTYYGTTYNCAHVHSDGFITLGSQGSYSGSATSGLPSSSMPAPLISALMTPQEGNVWPSGSCNVAITTDTTGSTGKHVFIVQWSDNTAYNDWDMANCGGSGVDGFMQNYQIKLYEETSNIELVLQSVNNNCPAFPDGCDGNGGGTNDPALVGIQDASKTYGLTYAYPTVSYFGNSGSQSARTVRFYPNHEPRAMDGNQTTVGQEDTPFNVTLWGLDPDGDYVHQFCLDTAPVHGHFDPAIPTCASGQKTAGQNVTYVPEHDYCSTDQFKVRGFDQLGLLGALPGKYDVSMGCINDPPTLDPVADFSIAEDSTYSLSLTGINPGGSGNDTVLGNQYPIAIGATSGDLAVLPNPVVTHNGYSSTGTLTFTPKANAYGVVPVTLTLIDFGNGTAPHKNVGTLTFNVTVVSVNDNPTFRNVPGYFDFDPTQGAQITYPNWATNISVGPQNEGSQKARFLVADYDPTLVTAAGIQVSPSGSFQTGPYTGDLTFTPTGKCGITWINVTLQDDDGAPGDVSVVHPYRLQFDCQPAANADHYAIYQDEALSVKAPGLLANDTDPDGDSLLVATSCLSGFPGCATWTMPQHDVAFQLNWTGSFYYAPDPTWFGTESFTYQNADGRRLSPVATVTIDVLEAFFQPKPDQYTLTEDTVLHVAAPGVLANDVTTTTPLSAALASAPTHAASFSLAANGSFVYLPQPDYFGPDSFTYDATDGTHAARRTRVNLTVLAVDDPPIALWVNDTVYFGATRVINLKATDVDTPQSGITFCLDSAPTLGSLNPTVPACASGTAAKGPITYHAPSSLATETWQVRAYDGTSRGPAATIRIRTIDVDQRPSVPDITLVVDEDTTKTLNLTGTDPDGDVLAFRIVNAPFNGAATLSGDALSYKPNANYCNDQGGAPDRINYEADDQTGSQNATSNQGTVRITVRCVDDAPSFTNAGDVEVDMNAPLTSFKDWATAISTGPPNESGQRVRFITTTYTNPSLFDPTKGGVPPYAMNPGSSFAPNPVKADLVVRPAANKFGVSTVTICLEDDALQPPNAYAAGGVDRMSPCTQIQVGVRGPPVVKDDTYAIYSDKSLLVPAPGVMLNDVNWDGGTPPEALWISGPVNAQSWDLATNGTLAYTPAVGFFGNETITYYATDLHGHQSNVATITIVVTRNNVPVAEFDAVSQYPQVGESVQFTDRSTDIENRLVAWAWSFGDGDFSTDASPAHTYQVAGDFDVILTVTDDGGRTSSVSHPVHVQRQVAGASGSGGLEGPSRQPPVAIAPPGQSVRSGDTVTLVGAGTPQESVSRFEWQRLGTTPPVTLVGTHGRELSFVAPDLPPGTALNLTFSLVVNDGLQDSAPVIVVVHVAAANAAPTLQAPDVAATAGRDAQLLATASDPDKDNLTVTWRQLDGAKAAIRDADTLRPRLVGSTLAEGTLTFQVSVDDGHHPAVTANVKVVVGPPVNASLTFAAAEGKPGQVVFTYLQPHEGDQLAWDFGDGATSTQRDPVHTYAKSGLYTVRLTVTDANGQTLETKSPVVVHARDATSLQGTGVGQTGAGTGATGTGATRTTTSGFPPWVAFAALGAVGLAVGLVVLVRARRKT